jgi:hypothetical protein
LVPPALFLYFPLHHFSSFHFSFRRIFGMYSVLPSFYPALIYFIPSFLSSYHQCHVIFPLSEVFWVARFFVVSIRIMLLLPGNRSLPQTKANHASSCYIFTSSDAQPRS